MTGKNMYKKYDCLGGMYGGYHKEEKWLHAIGQYFLGLITIVTLFAMIAGLIGMLYCSACLYHGMRFF